MSEQDSVTTTAQLGALLRELRGTMPVEAVARHAKRHGYYVPRPGVPAIEDGRRLPTCNELRGILLACEREDLFDRLNEDRRRLQDGGRSVSGQVDGESRPVKVSRSYPVAPGIAAVVLVVVGVVSMALVLRHRSTGAPVSPTTDGIDAESAVVAARESPLCAESLTPRPDARVTVLARESGPADAVEPDRLVEVRAYRDPDHGWVAWAHLARPASDRDKLWLDWSYLSDPRERQHWRQCGPHAIGAGPDSPAVRGVDADGRARWVRACGQAPAEQRPPSSVQESFCSGWVPVRP
ncbi:hypothetical protein ACQPZF_22990 [Actinosynnema sp. CS-041913]|uniref:hypothetical protein n=1 Tax=Actinosynnema sp. CS-041913 TaxID=3239917 RepID=UPI003D94204E